MTTLELITTERNPCNWMHRMINLADRGTRIIYWRGHTDVMPTGRRKEVFEFAMKCSEGNRVRLYQGRENDIGVYFMEVV